MEIIIIILVGVFKISDAIHCDKELNYHENYGYGFDVSCEGLTDATWKILRDIAVYKEVKLQITGANLTNITSDLFINIPNVKIIIIANSTMKFTDWTNLVDLEHFVLENSEVVNFSNNIVSLKEWNLLNSSVEPMDLMNLTNLELLKISHNQMRDISTIPFCNLHRLKYLVLDHNRIEELPKLTCFQIHSYLVPYQTAYGVNLEEIDLSFNNFTKMPDLSGLVLLQSLNFSSNRIGKITSGDFNGLRMLEKLDLCYNSIEIVDGKAFTILRYLKSLEMRGNFLREISIWDLASLDVLDLGGNRLELLKLENLTELKKLYLDENRIGYLNGDFLGNFSKLDLLDLSGNRLNLIRNRDFSSFIELFSLNIGKNRLKLIEEKSFDNLAILSVLDLSGNELSDLPLAIFSNLNNLRTLNLSHNLITNVDYDLLKSLHNLQVLDIAGNKLAAFQFNAISSLPSLRSIDIRLNLLTCDKLADIVHQLKVNHISYTFHQNYNDAEDRKNIAGIYCEDRKFTPKIFVFIFFGILVFVAVMSLVVYKFVKYSKRRRYFMDEIELMED